MSVFENHDPDSLIGSVLDGRFRLETELSRVTASTTYSATDLLSQLTVVLRLFSAEFTIGNGVALLEQAAVMRQIDHPHIVRLTSFGRTAVKETDRVYVVHEQLLGGSLQDMIDRNRLLTPSQALVVGVEVCRALDYAHKRGLAHHDLRPSVIMFGEDARVRVADIGISSVIAESAWEDNAMISQERARYCSPEQALSEPFDEKADTYALALILVESVTGMVPFLADSVVGTLSARVDKLFPVSADLGGLAAVLDKAGRSDPMDRSSALEMGRALVQAAPTLVRPTPIPIVSSMIFGMPPEPDRSNEIPRGPQTDHWSETQVIDEQMQDEATTDVATATQQNPLIGRWIMAALAVLVLITGGYFLFNTLQKESFPVPDLMGLEQGQATNLVTEFKWKVVTVEQPDDLIAVGSVIRTEPENGKDLQSGKKLTLIVSTGPPPVPLPELKGLDAATAIATLTNSGLKLGTEAPESDEDIPAGIVLRWEVSLQPNLVAGQEVIKGSAVDIFVSDGPAPRVIPDLTGLTLEAATTMLNDLDLTLNRADDQFFIMVELGGVGSQSPLPGELLDRGKAVTVSISKGPDLLPVPQLKTLKIDQVRLAVVNAGFTLGKIRGDTKGFPIAIRWEDEVVTAGQQIPRGSVLDIFYYGS